LYCRLLRKLKKKYIM